jgi:hypothetical protein
MFTSVRRCTGDLACEVLILTCFGDLPPHRQLYLGMGTMIVKETFGVEKPTTKKPRSQEAKNPRI